MNKETKVDTINTLPTDADVEEKKKWGRRVYTAIFAEFPEAQLPILKSRWQRIYDSVHNVPAPTVAANPKPDVRSEPCPIPGCEFAEYEDECGGTWYGVRHIATCKWLRGGVEWTDKRDGWTTPYWRDEAIKRAPPPPGVAEAGLSLPEWVVTAGVAIIDNQSENGDQWFVECMSVTPSMWIRYASNAWGKISDYGMCMFFPTRAAAISRVIELGPQPWMRGQEKATGECQKCGGKCGNTHGDSCTWIEPTGGTHESAELAGLRGHVSSLEGRIDAHKSELVGLGGKVKALRERLQDGLDNGQRFRHKTDDRLTAIEKWLQHQPAVVTYCVKEQPKPTPRPPSRGKVTKRTAKKKPVVTDLDGIPITNKRKRSK